MLGSVEVARVYPVFHPELGKFFKDLRESRGWSVRGASLRADDKGLGVLNYQVLFRLEHGQIKNPRPDVVRALAQLYGLRYEDVAQRFVARRFGLSDDPPTAVPTIRREVSAPQVSRYLMRARRLLEEMSDVGLKKAVEYLALLAAAHPRAARPAQTRRRAGTT